MNWELLEVEVDNGGGHTKTFHFDLEVGGNPNKVWHGDGLLLGNGEVRLNREGLFRSYLEREGVNADHAVGEICSLVAANQQGRAAAQFAAAS